MSDERRDEFIETVEQFNTRILASMTPEQRAALGDLAQPDLITKLMRKPA